ncbi:MAG: HAMP domain-containing sensor histidine kinase [Pseudonocardiales bacterium]|nr:HAMP domain-containing histidine kinase [Actinomycetota bacterium]
MSSHPFTGAVGVTPPTEPWPGDAEPVDPNSSASLPPDWAGPPPAPPDAESGPRRWRFLPRSLTGRLVTFVVSLVVVVVLATGIGTFYALRAFLVSRLDQQLQSTASGSLEELFGPGRPTAAVPGVRAPQHVWAIALHPSGEVLRQPASPAVEELRLSPEKRRELAGRTSGAAITVHTTDGYELRVTTRSVIATSLVTRQQTPGTAVIGLSTDEIDRTVRRLLELELLIGASAVVLALVATAYGVRLSLGRLYRVTRTAREVAAELSPEGAGLERRVPGADSGTEVGQLAESMNTLLAAVETQFAARLANEQRMRQFLADASHELRTPLTSIRGYAELARMQRQQGEGEPADNLARIESEGTRMSRLVDDLLTLARSDQGALPQREVVDVADVLDEAVTGAQAAYPQRRIDSHAEPGLTVVGDRDQLLRLVRNLVTNAAVHTRPDGPISVLGDRDGDTVVIRIVDAGPGLPADEAAHVFERFWRADKARSRVRGGTGLGLAIVASIVSAHGGTVHFASTVAAGSTVTVRLPLRTG